MGAKRTKSEGRSGSWWARGPAGKAAFPIVGIGASAGGLESFTELLRRMPANTGMSFVFILHLDPKHASKLSEILSAATAMPVQEAANGMKLKPDHVYVIPPDADISLREGKLLVLSPRLEVHGQHMAIDTFFKSLAEGMKSRAVGIVLSGTASDGTNGLRAIRNAGGVTMAQDEASARYPDMPHHAIVSGVVDHVLSPARIAAKLVDLTRHPQAARRAAIPRVRHGSGGLKGIFEVLRKVSGIDFSVYKRATILRRLKRRMAMRRVEGLDAYLNTLEHNTAEVEALQNDMLIMVTGFFRDSRVWQALRARGLPRILKGRPRDVPIRVWVAGCSTGEEVYSAAMILLEYLEETRSPTRIQIFGTDVSNPAIDKARKGFYRNEEVSRVVSAERLRRFFVKSGGGYQVNKSVRDMCTFARHDLTRDPPFSVLDLISCRNTLIYLERSYQEKIITAFHYGLKPGGLLLMGTSEAADSYAGLFEVVDRKARIYAKKPQLGESVRPSINLNHTGVVLPPAQRPGAQESQSYDPLREANRLLIARYSPPGVLVNESLEIIQFRGQMGPYLDPASGRASLDLLKMVKECLATEVRLAIGKAEKTREPVIGKTVTRVSFEGLQRDVRIDVLPVRSPTGDEKPYYLVSFVEVALVPAIPPAQVAPAPPVRPAAALSPARIARLEQDLEHTRDHLRSIIEERENSNEELRVANEEVLSSNEELQSLNEELETAKEELQSSNEELNTVNEELLTRNLELTQSNNDLDNLLGSSRIPIIVLSRDLKVRRYTPVSERALRLIPSDVGRHIGDVRLSVEVHKLSRVINGVIESMAQKEQDIQDRDGRWYHMSIIPYKTRDNRIDGAVIVFIDIDEMKRSSLAVKASLDFAEAIVETVREPLLVLNRTLKVEKANRAFYRLFKVTPGETIGRLFHCVDEGRWAIPGLRAALSAVIARGVPIEGYEIEYAFPSAGKRILLLHARRIVHGENLMLVALEDITERKRADALKVSLEEKEVLLREVYHRVKNNMQVMASLLTLQSATVSDEKAREVLEESQNRIKTMALVHESLYRSTNLSSIDWDAYARNLCASLADFYGKRRGGVAVRVRPGGVRLGVNFAIPCGLIANELVSNSLKYAFPRGRRGSVVLGMERGGGQRLRLTVRDDGVGLPAALNPRSAKTLGLHLVHLLAEKQLGGKLSVKRGRGAIFTVDFREKR